MGSKRNMQLVIPHSHNHEVLAHNRLFKEHIIPCRRVGMTKMTSANEPRQPQWVMKSFLLKFHKKLN